MKKNSILFLGLVALLAACNNEPAARKDVKQYSAVQLFNNKAIGGGAFNTDESKILVHANNTGIFNLFEISIADTLMKPLTNSTKESFFSVDYLPGSNKYLYSADQGGNENSHIYLQSPADTAAKDITPWTGSSNSMFGWSADKKSIYISSNKRDPKYFDILKADTATWAFTMFFQNDSGYNASDISKSERYVTLNKSITTDKNEMYLYDRNAKTMKRISNDNEATWFSSGFEKNDSIMYYITNDGGEFSYLVKYNINSGAADKMFESKWDVGGMNLSENEKYHTIFINEDGKNKVLLFDHASNKPVDFPEIKDGDVKGVVISPTEKNMLLTVGSSRSPDNLYSYNFETKTLKQLTQTLNTEVDANDLVAADDLRRVHAHRPVVSGAGALAAQIRGGDSVVRLDHDFGRRAPARLRPAAGHRAVSILRRCGGVFPRRRGDFIFCQGGTTAVNEILVSRPPSPVSSPQGEDIPLHSF